MIAEEERVPNVSIEVRKHAETDHLGNLRIRQLADAPGRSLGYTADWRRRSNDAWEAACMVADSNLIGIGQEQKPRL
jgi:hypothetical protein